MANKDYRKLGEKNFGELKTICSLAFVANSRFKAPHYLTQSIVDDTAIFRHSYLVVTNTVENPRVSVLLIKSPEVAIIAIASSTRPRTRRSHSIA